MGSVPREILKWVLSLDLSYPVKNVRRDFANGFLFAELLSRYYPADIQMHSFENVASSHRKKQNWIVLEKFFKKKKLPVEHSQIEAVMASEGDAAVELLQTIHSFINSPAYEMSMEPDSKITTDRLNQLANRRDRGYDASTSNDYQRDGYGSNYSIDAVDCMCYAGSGQPVKKAIASQSAPYMPTNAPPSQTAAAQMAYFNQQPQQLPPTYVQQAPAQYLPVQQQGFNPLGPSGYAAQAQAGSNVYGYAQQVQPMYFGQPMMAAAYRGQMEYRDAHQNQQPIQAQASGPVMQMGYAAIGPGTAGLAAAAAGGPKQQSGKGSRQGALTAAVTNQKGQQCTAAQAAAANAPHPAAATQGNSYAAGYQTAQAKLPPHQQPWVGQAPGYAENHFSSPIQGAAAAMPIMPSPPGALSNQPASAAAAYAQAALLAQQQQEYAQQLQQQYAQEYSAILSTPSDSAAKANQKDEEKMGLEYSRKPRPVDYQPYDLKDFEDKEYNIKKAGKNYWELGRLGPDLETEELQSKREKQERIKQLAQQVREENQKKAAQQASKPRREPVKVEPTAREKALMFAKNIPKPEPPKPKAPPSKAASAGSGGLAVVARGPASELEQLEAQHSQDLQRVDAIRAELARMLH